MASNVLGYKIGLDWGATASEALTEHTAVAIDFDNGTCAYPAAQGDRVDGIVQRSYASGEQAKVILSGIVTAKIKTAGTIVKGDKLMAATDGEFLEATTGEIAIAEALNAPVADGDEILVKLITAETVA